MSIFDTTPSSGTTTAVPGVQPQLPNDKDRNRMLYIQDVWDPDTSDPAKADSYLIPREGELIYDVINKIIYVAVHVANQDAGYKTTMEIWMQPNTGNNDDNATSVIGASGGFQGDAVLGINYAVSPPRAQVDGRVWAPGAAYALLYKGDVIGSTGTVVSALYNTGGELVSTHVPVVLAALDPLENATIMVCGQCSVSLNKDELPDGSRVTVVFFDVDGNPIRNAQALSVQHTQIMRDHQIGKAYIESVELLAPWFTDNTDPDTLNIPVNVALTSVEFRVQINYTTGNPVIRNIDNNKIQLIGVNNYKPTAPGAIGEMVLVYNLDNEEQAQLSDPGNPNQIRHKYNIQAVQVDGAYSPKLFTYPVGNVNTGYVLRHFLYDLDRQIARDVTQYVVPNELSPSFNPTAFGIEQNMIFNLLLSDVSPSFNNWTVVQHTTIVLYTLPTTSGRKWDVRYDYGTDPYLAYQVKGTVGADGKQAVSFKGSFTDVKAWLARLYTAVGPLVNTVNESTAPTPNMVRVVDTYGNATMMSVDNWFQDLTLSVPVSEGQTLFMQWIKQNTDGSQLQLATTGVVVSANPVN